MKKFGICFAQLALDHSRQFPEGQLTELGQAISRVAESDLDEPCRSFQMADGPIQLAHLIEDLSSLGLVDRPRSAFVPIVLKPILGEYSKRVDKPAISKANSDFPNLHV